MALCCLIAKQLILFLKKEEEKDKSRFLCTLFSSNTFLTRKMHHQLLLEQEQPQYCGWGHNTRVQ